jgi:hypothetical protein
MFRYPMEPPRTTNLISQSSLFASGTKCISRKLSSSQQTCIEDDLENIAGYFKGWRYHNAFGVQNRFGAFESVEALTERERER